MGCIGSKKITNEVVGELIEDNKTITGTVIGYNNKIENQEIDKLKNIFKKHFNEDSNVYNNWYNFYYWNKYIFNEYDNEHMVILNQIFNKNFKNLSIELIFNKIDTINSWYFIVRYPEWQWGNSLGCIKYSYDDNFTYKIIDPRVFLEFINYFDNKNCENIKDLIPLGDILKSNEFNKFVNN